MRSLLVIGDALLDRDVTGIVERLCPDAPVPVLDERERGARPGGAALAAALAAADGREVTLVSALGKDAAGRELARLLDARGVELIDVGLGGPTPEKIRLRDGGRPLLRLDRGGLPAPLGRASASARAAIGWAEAILVADYGRGMAAQPAIRAALRRAAAEAPLVWDPHVRGARPVRGVEVATPNEAEAGCREALADGRCAQACERGQALLAEWGVRHVCVTCGAAGAVLCGPASEPQRIATAHVSDGDTCGAGDRFSSALAGALADGARPLEAARRAVERACAFVAGGAAGALAAPEHPRQTGGQTVVATGGCFDLLHRGHVHTLQAARALGDRLVVCLNSDASVRRLKGPSRPVVSQADRAAVLAALECVDEVVVFDDDTPIRALERLRPDIWAKGGDYLPHDLPEAPTVARWGGQVVTLPYVDGHSTTELLKEVACRVAS